MWAPSRERISSARWAWLLVSIVVAATAYLAMAGGWIAALAQMERDRHSPATDTVVLAEFIASAVVLIRGGGYALLFWFHKRAAELRAEMRLALGSETYDPGPGELAQPDRICVDPQTESPPRTRWGDPRKR